MLAATLPSSLLGSVLSGKGLIEQTREQLEWVKEKLELDRIFNTTSSFK